MRSPVPVGKPGPITHRQHLEQVPTAARTPGCWGRLPGVDSWAPCSIPICSWRPSCLAGGAVVMCALTCHLWLPPPVTSVGFLHLHFMDELTAPAL